MTYARIENNQVVVYQDIPQQWVFTNPNCDMYEKGASTGNFKQMPVSFHLSEGFLPLVDVQPEYNPATQRLTDNGYSVESDKVIKEYLVEDIPQAEIDAINSSRLENAKNNLKSQVETMRDNILAQGFTFQEKTYSCDLISRTNLALVNSFIQANQSVPEGFGWKANGENQPTAMDLLTFSALVSAAGDFCNEIYTKAFSLKQEIEALSTLEGVSQFSINFGSP